MKNYERISLEIMAADDVVTTSSEVETEKLPFASVDDMGSYQL